MQLVSSAGSAALSDLDEQRESVAATAAQGSPGAPSPSCLSLPFIVLALPVLPFTAFVLIFTAEWDYSPRSDPVPSSQSPSPMLECRGPFCCTFLSVW